MAADVPGRAPAPRWCDWGVVAVAAAVVGGLAFAAGVPGGIVFGAAVGAGAVVLVRDRAWEVPGAVRSTVMIAVGTTVGMRVTPETIGVLGGAIGPAALAAVLLVAAGWLIAATLDKVGIHVPGGLMATSPGALEVLTVLAIEDGEGPLEVALFHLVRVVLVMVSVPLLLLLV